jgi:dGTPase
VLYSSAFGRLAGVTQVFQAAEGQTYHNRLTHSLKVAQIARRTAESLIKKAPAEAVAAAGGLNADVAETAALCHDLGHPPFGHAAEEALNDRVGEKNGGFEGNAQTLRIVCTLAIHGDEWAGLNLTRASLAAVLKYPWKRGENGQYSTHKWGAYEPESADFTFAREGMLAADFRKSLEAEVMDWSDDVTYSVHDLDDCYRSGLIPLDRLLVRPDERAKFIDFVETLKDFSKPTRAEAEQTIRGLFDDVLGVFGGTDYDLDLPFAGTRKQRAGMSVLASILISRYVADLSITPDGPTRLTIPPGRKMEVWLLKQLMKFYVYESPALVGQQVGQRKLVEELFDIFLDAAAPASKQRGIVPHPFRERLEELKTEGDRARFSCDIVASMTEQQALLMHKRLTGIEPGSVLDSILR